MWDLSCEPVVFESRHQAYDRLGGAGCNGCDVGMTGYRVARFHVDTARPACDLAAFNGPLKCDSRHAERFEVARSHESVSFHVPNESFDMAGGRHDRCGEVLRFLGQNIVWQRFRNILALGCADCPHSQHDSMTPA